MNFNPNLTFYTKINSTLIIDLNINHKTINLFEEKIGENLQKLGLGEEFLDMTQKHDS